MNKAYLRENSRWDKIETQVDFQFEVTKKVQLHFTNYSSCFRSSSNKDIILLVSTPTNIYITTYSIQNKKVVISRIQTITSQCDQKRVFSHSPDSEYIAFSENSEIHVWKRLAITSSFK